MYVLRMTNRKYEQLNYLLMDFVLQTFYVYTKLFVFNIHHFIVIKTHILK